MPDLESEFRAICEELNHSDSEERVDALTDLFTFVQENPQYETRAIPIFQNFLRDVDPELQVTAKEYLQMLRPTSESAQTRLRTSKCPILRDPICLEKDSQGLSDFYCDHPTYQDCPIYQTCTKFEFKVGEIIRTKDFAALADGVLQLLDRIQKLEKKFDTQHVPIWIIILFSFLVPTVIFFIILYYR